MTSPKKTQCEICHNDTCPDRGKRNIHFDGVKHGCSRFIKSEKEAKGKKLMEEIKESFRRNPIKLFMEDE